jgi:hypothetical protein
MQLRGNKCIGYVTLNGRATASNELETVWKQEFVPHLQNDTGSMWKTMKRRVVEIRTQKDQSVRET